MSTFIKDYKKYLFAIFINNYNASKAIFEILFKFFYEQYFFKCVFDSIYLLDYKIQLFLNSLEILEFEESTSKLRSLLKYKKKILN